MDVFCELFLVAWYGCGMGSPNQEDLRLGWK